MSISPELFTFVHIVILIAMVIITYQYTNATKRMSKLEEERKIWEVQPIIAPLNNEVIKDSVSGGGIALKIYHFQMGIKNIGRGVATVTDLKCSHKDPSIREKVKLFPPTFYLGINEEFICVDIKDRKFKFDPGQLSWNCKFTDMHGNKYETSFEYGNLKSKRIVI